MKSAGVDFKGPIIADGEIHRFAPSGKKERDGWYVFFGLAGVFGEWSQGIRELWSLKGNGIAPLNTEEIQVHIQKAKRRFAEETLRKQEEFSITALERWEALSATGHSPYLERKKVDALGVRFEGQNLIVPLRDTAGKFWSLQTIHPDGTKCFLAGGRKAGCFHLMGTPAARGHLYVAEGYATGASVYRATSNPVAIAFDAGNLDPVVEALTKAYSQTSLILAGDEDQWKDNNVGRKTAEDVAQKYGCSVVFPTFKNTATYPTDFNDLHVLEGLEEVKRQLEQLESSLKWPSPFPLHALKQDLSPVPVFPPALIPEPYQEWLCDIAERMQCPLDYVAIGALVVTSSLIGTGCRIRPKAKDSWAIIPNLWGGIVGAPSTLKSPALKEIMRPIEALEKKAYEEYKSAYQDYLIDLEASKALQEAIRKEMTRAAACSDAFALGESKERLRTFKDPEEPSCKRYLVNDTTIEKMHELLSRNPRGLLLFRDELLGLLTQWNKSGHESDRAFYLEAWNGDGSNTVDRIGRGTLYAENICLSLLGSTQPLKLTTYFEKALQGSDNDGLLQRFQLLVYPDLPRDWRLVDKHPNEKARNHASALMHKLASMDFTLYGALLDPTTQVPYFQFDDQAQAIFYEWFTDLETKLKNYPGEPILAEHLSKYRKLMPSLALIFHLINLANGQAPGPVPAECAERAAGWCDYLEAHAQRIYALGINPSWQAARTLARKIQGKEVGNPFDLRDIYRKQWTLLKDKDEVVAACHNLEQKGWLRQSQVHKEGKIKTIYSINPKIQQGRA
jgi:putative DNA primase/helicase